MSAHIESPRESALRLPDVPVLKSDFFKRARIYQIRHCAKALIFGARLPLFRRFIGGLMHLSPARFLLHNLVGYRRSFSSLTEATQYAGRFLAGHEAPDNIDSHLALGEKARPSDYAALFHLGSLLRDNTAILDIGGSAGNLFYCYSRYLPFSPNLTWIVFDLPKTVAVGQEIAHQRAETRLRFTSSLNNDIEVNALLISGALHYFDVPLSKLIAQLKAKPPHVIINRTPLSRRVPFVTVQDASSHLVACKVSSADSVTMDLESIGYSLIDSWQVGELSLHVPCCPEFSVPFYSGMYFVLRDRRK